MSDIDAARHSWRLWAIAATCAILLHGAGIAAAVIDMRNASDGEGLGNGGLETSIELAVEDAEETSLPPGPDSDASAASPEVAEQKAVEKESDLPKEQLHEAEDADRAVTENDAKKPNEETPDPATKQQQASQASVASEAAQRQKLVGNAKEKIVQDWNRDLSLHLERHKPTPSERQKNTVEVLVSFEFNRVGHVLSVKIARSSGQPAFDEAALAMVRRSDPLPLPPSQVTDDTFSYTVPVKFLAPKGKG